MGIASSKFKPVRIQAYVTPADGEVFRLYQRADGQFVVKIASLSWLPADLRGRSIASADYSEQHRICVRILNSAAGWRALAADGEVVS